MDKKRLQELAGVIPKEIILLNEGADVAYKQIVAVLNLAKKGQEMYKKGTLDLPEFVDDLISKLEQIERQLSSKGRMM